MPPLLGWWVAYALLHALVDVGHRASADNLTSLHHALKEALLTEDNLYHLQYLLFPPEGTTNGVFRIVICKEDFRVLDIEYLSDGAFINNSDSDHYERNYNCSHYEYPCAGEGLADVFVVSSQSKYSLISYITSLCGTIRNADEAFFELLTHLLGPSTIVNAQQSRNYYSPIPTANITMVVKKLQNNPEESDLKNVLSLLLSWSKYYSRPTSPMSTISGMENDQLIVHMQCDDQLTQDASYSISLISHSLLILMVLFFVNVIIMICSLYIIYKVEMASNSFWTYVKSIKTVNIILWKSFAIVSFILNAVYLGFIVIALSVDYNNTYIYAYPTYVFFYTGLFSLIEIAAIHNITKKSMPQTKLCSRILLNFGICNIVWIFHRVGNCCLVSLYFIAIAPAQTLAAITLCLSSVMMLVVTTAMMLHVCYSGFCIKKKRCITTCKIILLLILLIGVIVVIASFTLIFVDLTQHGLTGSDMGSILLSLIIPILTLIVGLVVKKELKKNSENNEVRREDYKPLDDSNNVENIAINH